MLYKNQLKIADFYNISIGNVKKLVDNSFCERKVLRFLLEIRIKTKKNESLVRIQSITMAKTISSIQHTQKELKEKNWR